MALARDASGVVNLGSFATGVTSGAVTTTSGAGIVIVWCCGEWRTPATAAGTVAGVTLPGVTTFYKRGAVPQWNGAPGASFCRAELWWGYSSANITAQTLTVTWNLPGGVNGDNLTANFMGYHGFTGTDYQTNPFDPSCTASITNSASTAGNPTISGLTTSSATDELLFLQAAGGGSSNPGLLSAPTGFNQPSQAGEAGGNGQLNSSISDETVAAKQTNATITAAGATIASWGVLCDALAAAGGPPTFPGPQLETTVLTNGLGALVTNVTHITICAGEPSTYTWATNSNMLGYKNFGAGNAFTGPTNAGGLETVTSVAITPGSGTVSTGGVANWWAAVDETGTTLYAHGQISPAMQIGAGFSLPSFTINMPQSVGFYLSAAALQYGLAAFALANKIVILSQTPTSYADCGTYALGWAFNSIGGCFGSVSASADGEQISSNAVTSGTVTANGTPTCWAVIDDANSRLLASGPATGLTTVTSGQIWTLGSFTIDIPQY